MLFSMLFSGDFPPKITPLIPAQAGIQFITRHCERSEAIQRLGRGIWIASSLCSSQ
jgi:hypothetical protein